MNVLTEYLQQYYDEVDYKEFYRDVFPAGSLQQKGVFEKGKYNGIIVELTSDKKQNGKQRVLRHTLTDDQEKLDEVVNRDNFCLMSPISYAGKTRDSSFGREIYALAFDLDGIQTNIRDGKEYPYGLESLIYQFEELDRLPKPTYIASSGTGLHLYYLFKQPIPMFDNIVEQLEVLKKELTRMMWHDSISRLVDDIQYEPVCQGFRMVGTITKNGDRVRSFSIGDKVDIDYLNHFVREDYKMKNYVYKSNLTLEQAKEKYSEWFQNRIIEKRPRKTWQFNRNVYDRWLERLPNEAKLGHRYWSVWVLAVTAMKCGISQEELERDAFGLIESMNKLDKTGSDPFTKEDVLAALEGYDSIWYTYPIEKMSYRSDIPIHKNKRNGLKQVDHLEIARAIQAIKDKQKGTNWRENNGRPSAEQMVKQWRDQHPSGSKRECRDETGLTYPTIRKWWNEV